jgi:DNA polymerase III delta prime subunit
MKRLYNFSELIGPAAQAAKILTPVIHQMKATGECDGGFLFYGPPGVGKTALAVIMASMLSEDSVDSIYDGCGYAASMISAVDLKVEVVRRWMSNRGLATLFGDWQIKLVEELDSTPADAQKLLLNYLDRIPKRSCFIGTSNMELNDLQERFQTRLRPFKIMPPETGELTTLLKSEGLDEYTAGMIAVGSGGNVRAALLDTRNALDSQLVAA